MQLRVNTGKEAFHQSLKLLNKQDTQVETSIKAKGQLYCYLSIAGLLSGTDWPHPFGNHLQSRKSKTHIFLPRVVARDGESGGGKKGEESGGETKAKMSNEDFRKLLMEK